METKPRCRSIYSFRALRAPARRRRAALRSVVRDTAVLFPVIQFDKSPVSNWLVAWHQDTALPLVGKIEKPGSRPWSTKDGAIYSPAPCEALDQVVALRVLLDDSTAENGPLRVISSTQCNGILSDAEVHEISMRNPSIQCTVAKGGFIAIRGADHSCIFKIRQPFSLARFAHRICSRTADSPGASIWRKSDASDMPKNSAVKPPNSKKRPPHKAALQQTSQ